ncbi:hypothetical protein HNP84_001417 [Thermocatellispora tengchongensis]|uniref:Cell division protein FtsL n=1 Tax=Thermocatellispora tengchongensis TaxID=1073253 RepID=A0A840NSP4_9ACTN|nr:hypothetical protein [Thermocatellispora tengchongensis]MBB5131704.1 hypothetical protein [Thermocatellispora tengchongensis]
MEGGRARVDGRARAEGVEGRARTGGAARGEAAARTSDGRARMRPARPAAPQARVERPSRPQRPARPERAARPERPEAAAPGRTAPKQAPRPQGTTAGATTASPAKASGATRHAPTAKTAVRPAPAPRTGGPGGTGGSGGGRDGGGVRLRRPLAARPGIPRRRGRAPRAPFVLLVVGLMCGGLVSLLLLNTVLAQDSFRADELRNGNKEILLKKEQLKQKNAQREMPEQVAEEALRNGMRPDNSPNIIVPDATTPTGRASSLPD